MHFALSWYTYAKGSILAKKYKKRKFPLSRGPRNAFRYVALLTSVIVLRSLC